MLASVARWAVPTVVLAQGCLVWTGVFSLGEAVAVGLAIELLLAGVVVAEVALGARVFRASRSQGADGHEALRQVLSAVFARARRQSDGGGVRALPCVVALDPSEARRG
ncbi:hypothetical protein ACF059_08945 [Streptomyces sp. NPDC016562]|uniref:hypothetical protein n=1 Tax=Streptomyces sp. NPDC016562 TaxID=3364966 RepID=UPI0036F83205